MIANDKKEEKFYSKWDVFGGSFLGGPLAGTYFLYENFKRLNQTKAAKYSLVIGIVGTILLFGILILLSPELSSFIPKHLIPVIYASFAMAIYVPYQGKAIEVRLKEGAKKKTIGKVLGVVFICLVVTVIYCYSLVLVQPLTSGIIAFGEYSIGCYYEHKQDGVNSMKWFQMAAHRELPFAFTSIGRQYNFGSGVQQNYIESLEWDKKGADLGDDEAQFNIGVLYLNGQGVKQDYAEAFKWFEMAALQGNPQAQYNVGMFYFKPMGRKEDDAKSFLWFKKAAENEVANAQFNLAVQYQLGKGVEKNTEEAKKWFRKAADQGDDEARQVLEKLK